MSEDGDEKDRMDLEDAIDIAKELLMKPLHEQSEQQRLLQVEKDLANAKVTTLGLRELVTWIRSTERVKVRKMLLEVLSSVLDASARSQFSCGESSYIYPDAYIKCSFHKDDRMNLPPFNFERLRGYSFTSLVCLSNNVNEQNASHRGLFSFLASDGHGVEAVLWVVKEQVKCLVRVRSVNEKNWQHVTCTLPTMKLYQWHHLSIAHSNPYLASSMLTIYVDGRKQFEQPLNYPKFENEELIANGTLGLGLGGKFARPTLYEGAINDAQAMELVEGMSRMRVPVPQRRIGKRKRRHEHVQVAQAPPGTPAHGAGAGGSDYIIPTTVSKRFSLSRIGHVTSEGIHELRNSVQDILKLAPNAPKRIQTVLGDVADRLSPRYSRAGSSESMSSIWANEADMYQRRLLSKLHKYDDLPIVFVYDSRTCIGGNETIQGWEVHVKNGVLESASVQGKRRGANEDQVIEPVQLKPLQQQQQEAVGGGSGGARKKMLIGSPTSAFAGAYARLHGDATVVYDREPHPTLEPLGGLLPLIVTLVELLPAQAKEEFDLNPFIVEEKPDGIKILPKLVDVIGEALYAKELYREDFANHGGFGLIGWVLQRIAPNALDMALVKSCMKAVIYAGYVDASLRCEGLLLVLFDHNIWGRADPSVQRYWVQRLLDYVHRNMLESRIVVGVPTILDLLEACSTSDETVIRLSPNCVPSLVEIIHIFFQTKWLADDDESIALARATIAAVAMEEGTEGQNLVQFNKDPGPAPNEISALLGFISRFPRGEASSRLLKMLASFLLPMVVKTKEWNHQEIGQARTMYDSLQTCGGVEMLLGIGSKDTETRMDSPRHGKQTDQNHQRQHAKSARRIIEKLSGAVGPSGGKGKDPNPSGGSESPPVSPGTIGVDSSSPLSPGIKRQDSFTMNYENKDNEDSPNGILAAAQGIPAGTRASMILLIGRMIHLEEEIEISQMLKEHANSKVQQEQILDASKVRRQKYFGIVLRSIMPVQHVLSFRLDEKQVERVSRDANPIVLDAILSIVFGCASSQEDVDDFMPHDDSLTLAIPDALPVLGGLLGALSKADDETKSIAAREVLLKLSLAMKASHSAREQVTSLPRWQSWLIPVLLLHEQSLNQQDDESADYLLGEVATDLLCTLMEHETQRPDDSLAEAKKLNRGQYGWYAWQGLAESTIRVTKEKERSLWADVVLRAKNDPEERFLIPEYNAVAEIKATKKTARVLRQVLERVWERLIVRLKAGGLCPDAIRNFMMTLVMAEETLLDELSKLRLQSLSPGGIIASSSSTTFLAYPAEENPSSLQSPQGSQSQPHFGHKPVSCNAKCAIDNKYGTKWVDATNDPESSAQSWLSYRYPAYNFLTGDDKPLSTRHRVVLYVVKSAHDFPELDPSGWTLFGRTRSPTDSSQSDAREGGWVVLDRRSEVRFTLRYQAIHCWVQHTGKFDEYKIVFDPPTKRGKYLKQANGEKTFVKIQIGQVTFYECDVQEWHRDVVVEQQLHEKQNVENALAAHGQELHRFIKIALQTIVFIRKENGIGATGNDNGIRSRFSLLSSLASGARQPKTGGNSNTRDETPAKGQIGDVSRRSVIRLLGHILRNAAYFPESVIDDAITIVRSYMNNELSVNSPSNQNLLYMLLHCIHTGLCSVLNEDSPKQDSLFGLVLSIHTQAKVSSVQQFLLEWHDSPIAAEARRAVEVELEGEALIRHTSFKVERSSSTTMARKSNPVEVAAYGAGRSVRPVVLSKSARRRLSSLLMEQSDRTYIGQVSRATLYAEIESSWRKLLEQDEIEQSMIHRHRYPVRLYGEGKKFRRNLYVLDKFVDPVYRIKTRLVPNPNGNPHLGASSGILDRVKRKREKEEEEDLIGLAEANNLVVEHDKNDNEAKWEDIGSKLSKQIAIADISLMTRLEEEEEEEEEQQNQQQEEEDSSKRTDPVRGFGKSDRPLTINVTDPAGVRRTSFTEEDDHDGGARNDDDDDDEDEESGVAKVDNNNMEEQRRRTSSTASTDGNTRPGLTDRRMSVPLSVVTQKPSEERVLNKNIGSSTPVPPTPPSAVSILQNPSSNKHRKLTLEEWINRSPDPMRGEVKDPWPAKHEVVYAAARCHVICPDSETIGRLIVSQDAIYFDPDPPNAEKLFIMRPDDYSYEDEGRLEHDADFEGENSQKWQQELSKTHADISYTLRRREIIRRQKRRRRLMWSLKDDVDRVLLRRYHMRDSAFELFTRGERNKSYLFDFPAMVACTLVEHVSGELSVRETVTQNGNRVRDQLLNRLWHALPGKVKRRSQKPGESNRSLLARYTEYWQRREISNFEYLMKLNAMAGRSLNDLTQYPVFPWVISDYDSETIDLSDPEIYRDLSKPMGALSEDRVMEARERYRTFDDPSMPKFHWGSHYSTMTGVVLYFLVRMEPFTSLHITMQDGHFDIPDRLFNSVSGAWKMCNTVMSEVKELTPEFYSVPEFLVNHNQFDLGTSQDGNKIEGVELPPWAKGSPERFVVVMREALESEFVSNHLHLWIDLIFGNKSRLPDAADADNVFYYLTYPGAVDMDAIEDPAMRLATELQIKHFGQCPMQLFTRPHPPRNERLGGPFPLNRFLGLGEGGLDYNGKHSFIVSSDSGAVLAIRLAETRAICLHENGDLCCYIWGRSEETVERRNSRNDSTSTQQTEDTLVDMVVDTAEESAPIVRDPPPLVMLPAPEALDGVELPPDQHISCPPIHQLPLGSLRRRLTWSEMGLTGRIQEQLQRGALAWSRDGRILVHSGVGIGALEVYFIDTASAHLRTWSATVFAHSTDVTAAAIHGSTMVSGSRDGAVRVWEILDGDEGFGGSYWGISSTPRLSLVGHDLHITSLSVSELKSLVVSISTGRCLLHSLHNGALLGSFDEAAARGVSFARISEYSGRVVLFTDDCKLFLYRSSLVGDPLVIVDTEERLYDAIISSNSFRFGSRELLLTAGTSGIVKAWALDDDLKLVGQFKVWPEGYKTTLQVPGREQNAYPPLHSLCLNPSEEALIVGASDGTLCLFPLPNFVSSGPDVTIPLVGSMDVKEKLVSAKNAVLTKIDTTRVLATARGVATEAVGVASKLAKGFSSVFGGGA